MSVSLGIDLSETKGNQDISTESNEDYTIDPIRELIGTIGCCSAVGFVRFLAHKVKVSLSIAIETTRTSYLFDLGTLLYIITLIGALTSISISICSNGNSSYISNKFDIWTMNKVQYNEELDPMIQDKKILTEIRYWDNSLIYGKWGYKDLNYNLKDPLIMKSIAFDTDTRSTNDVISHIGTSFLLIFSLIIPMFIYNILNSQLIII